MVPMMVAIGASNTAGLYGEYAADVVYTEVLEDLLRESDGKEFYRFDPGKVLEDGGRVINEGIPGNTTYDIAERLQADLVGYHPEYGIIQAGTNDVGIGIRAFHKLELDDDSTASRQYRYAVRNAISIDGAVEKLAKWISAKIIDIAVTTIGEGIKPVICTIPPYGNIGMATNAPEVHDGARLIMETNQKLYKFAGSPPFILADLHSALVNRNTGFMLPEFSHGDLLHLSTRGQVAVAGVIYSRMSGKKLTIEMPDQRQMYFQPR